MKKIYLAAMAVFTLSAAQAQSLSEDFDSYAPGDYMGVVSPDWTTWSGTTGGAEDVQVTNNASQSGDNALYFSTTSPNGGPQDVVVPFGGEYNSGDFVFETAMYVESGKGAYFNFQANSVIGQVWSMNMNLNQDGLIVMDDGVSVLLEANYNLEEWFTIRVEANLNTNEWELLVDGVSFGVSQNAINQVASLDIFPVNANYGGNNISGFYVDDLSYEHTAYVFPQVNGGVTFISGIGGLASQNASPSVQVRNLGLDNITSFDVSVSYNGETYDESVSGIDIANLDYYTVDFSDEFELVAGENDVVATISNVNAAGADGDAADDVKTSTINPLVPAPGRVVVGEEGTGTWCQWCPRGAVFMDLMEERYGEFWAGIAVHNQDPMVYAPYDAGFGTILAAAQGGYPSAIVDRGAVIDPSTMEADFLQRIVTPATGVITAGAEYDESTNVLSVSLSTEFMMDVDGSDYNLALVLTEDGVTGSGNGWSQSNAYAGGNNGEMGGYENLPNPVPASQMVYDHVGRIIMPGFGGASDIFPDVVTAGEVYVANFYVTMDESWETENMHIVGMLIDNSSDQIDNAGKAGYDEAISNGFVLGVDDNPALSDFNMFPNPTQNNAYIELGITDGKNVSVSIFDMNGRVVAQRNYGKVGDEMIVPLDTEDWAKGVYVVQVTVGEDMTNRKLVVD